MHTLKYWHMEFTQLRGPTLARIQTANEVRVREALREDARTHMGRMAQPVLSNKMDRDLTR